MLNVFNWTAHPISIVFCEARYSEQFGDYEDEDGHFSCGLAEEDQSSSACWDLCRNATFFRWGR